MPSFKERMLAGQRGERMCCVCFKFAKLKLATPKHKFYCDDCIATQNEMQSVSQLQLPAAAELVHSEHIHTDQCNHQ